VTATSAALQATAGVLGSQKSDDPLIGYREGVGVEVIEGDPLQIGAAQALGFPT
jgi:hypothetical protein